MTRKTDLVSYLPPFMAGFREVSAALEGENPEFDLAWEGAARLLSNRYLSDMDSCGAGRWEKILGIRPRAEDTLEIRRARIRAIWNRKPPYTLLWLKGWLAGICGSEGYPLGFELGLEDYRLHLRFRYDPEAGGKDRTVELAEDIAGLAPANLLLFPANIYDPIRFTWTPDALIFRRFSVLGLAAAHQYGGDYLKTALGAYRFTHYQGGVRFDGSADFDGEIPFGQTYGHVPFPRLAIYGGLRSQLPEEVSMRLGIGAGAFRNNENLDLPRLLRRAFRFSHYQGTARFDGSASFDGGMPFNQVQGKIPFPRLAIRGGLKSHMPERAFASTFWRIWMPFSRNVPESGMPGIRLRGFVFPYIKGGGNVVSDRTALGIPGLSIGQYRVENVPGRFSQRMAARTAFPGRYRDAGGLTAERLQAGKFLSASGQRVSVRSPVLVFSGGFPRVEGRFSMPSFSACSVLRAAGQGGTALRAVSLAGYTGAERLPELSGRVTLDNWRALDGAMRLDGSCRLDAYLREEKL